MSVQLLSLVLVAVVAAAGVVSVNALVFAVAAGVGVCVVADVGVPPIDGVAALVSTVFVVAVVAVVGCSNWCSCCTRLSRRSC